MTRKEWSNIYYNRYGDMQFAHKIWRNNPGIRFSGWSFLECEWATIDQERQERLIKGNLMQLDSLVCTAQEACKPMERDYFLEALDMMSNPPMVTSTTGSYPMNTIYGTKMAAGTDLTINMAPAASASVSSKSDVQIQREHLLKRLDEIRRDATGYYDSIPATGKSWRETFNLDLNNQPKTAKDLIDAIKNGKYKFDDRQMTLIEKGIDYDEVEDESLHGPFAGIIWDGPTPDKDGFDAARATFNKMLKDAKDTIVVKSPEDGLAAIQALEAWTPTTKAN